MPLSRLRPLAAALVAATGACASHRPAAAPAPVPVVEPSTAAGVLGPVRARAGRPGRAPADVTAGAPSAAPARVFYHTPGVTWDLDVLPYEGHDRVQRYVALFTGGARGRFTEWLSRGTRYDAMVRAKLRAGGLPEDLYYLALVESGYEPNAVSHAGAVGMWQFMAETARDVGLRVDWWVDERRDPVRATDAAVRMMRWLRGQFGSLFVAAAAYNGGPGRVSRGIAQLAVNDANAAAAAATAAALAAFDTANAAAAASTAPLPAAPPRAVGDARFFALAEAGVLRSETVNYVPQLIAAALVAKEAARHGIRVERRAALAYDEVRVPALTPLAAVAEVTGSTRAELQELNPHFLRGMTPPGGPSVVRVPEGAGEGAAEDLETLDTDVRRPFRRVITRRRDTWAALAERAGVSAAVLRAYNPRLETVERGKNRGRLVGNQAVRVPTDAVQAYVHHAWWDAAAPGALPSMPAPPPEPEPKPKKKPAKRSAGANSAAASEKPAGTDADKGAAKKAEKGAEKGAEKRADTAADEHAADAAKRTSGKGSDKAGETPEKANSDKPAKGGTTDKAAEAGTADAPTKPAGKPAPDKQSADKSAAKRADGASAAKGPVPEASAAKASAAKASAAKPAPDTPGRGKPAAAKKPAR